jgi:hypothetical protein
MCDVSFPTQSKHSVKIQFFWGLTLNLPTSTIVAPPVNASKWQMGFNSAFKGLNRLSTLDSSVCWCCLAKEAIFSVSSIGNLRFYFVGKTHRI